MKPELVVNVRPTHTATCDGLSRFELLAWVNDALKANFAKVDDLCTGAAYCQLMHSLFPNKISLKRVKFYTNVENDFFDNFKILQTTFQKLGVQKAIPIDKLCRGKFQDNIEFLQWFKKFYEANDQKDKIYDPIAARNGESIGYGLKTIKKNRNGGALSTPRDQGRNTRRSIKSTNEIVNRPVQVTLKRSLTKVHLKDDCHSIGSHHEKMANDEDDMRKFNEEASVSNLAGDDYVDVDVEDKANADVQFEEFQIDENICSEILSDPSVIYQKTMKKMQKHFEETRAETAELREQFNRMVFELRDVKDKLQSAQRTRDKFYRKLKDIGYCIKEAEDTGAGSVETLKITNILLGSGSGGDADGNYEEN